ncbi:MAG: BppU family phage baseplate upper protein [Sarcina sp.]
MRYDIGLNKTINIHKKNISTILSVTRRSNLTLRLALVDYYNTDIDTTNQKISLRITRSDGVTIEQVTDIEKNRNVLIIKLKNEAIEIIGECKCQINLLDSEGQMTTTEFIIEVTENNVTDEMIQSSDCFESLELMIVEFEKITTQINNDENIRKANERNRASAETTRNDNEVIRKSNETDRIDEENTRKTQENSRQCAEVTRIETFNTNEENRGITFTANESARQDSFTANEDNRIDTFAVNEEGRVAIFNLNEAVREKRCDSNIQHMLDDYNNLKFQILDENAILQLQMQIEELYRKIEVIENGGCGHNKTVITENGLITMTEDNKKIKTGGILNVL